MSSVRPATSSEYRAVNKNKPLSRQLIKLGERDKWTCHLCNRPVSPTGKGAQAPTRDHIVPRSQGGSDGMRNLRLAHDGCNKARGIDDLGTATRDLKKAAISREWFKAW